MKYVVLTTLALTPELIQRRPKKDLLVPISVLYKFGILFVFRYGIEERSVPDGQPS